MPDQNIFIVTPVFEDVAAATCLFRDLKEIYGKRVKIVAVDDGSVKHPLTASVLEQIGVDGHVIHLKRNVGHQRAIAIGLKYASEWAAENDRIVAMDSDGEDRPDTIQALLDALDDQTDIAVASRKSRIESVKFKTFYFFYKRFFKMLSGKSISFGNFMAMTRSSAKRLVAMQETTIHVAASVLASRLRLKLCLLDRGARYAGRSKMNFVGLVLHGFKALMVFAEDVLVRVGILSAGVAGLAIIGAILAVLLKLFGFATPGWFSLALGVLGIVLIQTGALALMMLMLTGMIRSGSVTTDIDYSSFVSYIETVES